MVIFDDSFSFIDDETIAAAATAAATAAAIAAASAASPRFCLFIENHHQLKSKFVVNGFLGDDRVYFSSLSLPLAHTPFTLLTASSLRFPIQLPWFIVLLCRPQFHVQKQLSTYGLTYTLFSQRKANTCPIGGHALLAGALQ